MRERLARSEGLDLMVWGKARVSVSPSADFAQPIARKSQRLARSQVRRVWSVAAAVAKGLTVQISGIDNAGETKGSAVCAHRPFTVQVKS